MVSIKDAVKLEEEIEDSNHNLIRELRFSNSGMALIDLLQNLSDIALKQMVMAPATDAGKIGSAQGRYLLINRLLDRIFEEEEEDNAESG